MDRNQTKAKLQLALMKKICGTGWGANQNVLKKLYIGNVRPFMEYGSAATSRASKSNTVKLTKIQSQAMRMMTDAMLTTPLDTGPKSGVPPPQREERSCSSLWRAGKEEGRSRTGRNKTRPREFAVNVPASWAMSVELWVSRMGLVLRTLHLI